MSSELTNIQVFSGDVKVTDGLRVDSSKLNVTSDTNRVGINQASPSTTLDVNGNVHTTSDLTVGTTLFHVDSTNKRVGIGTTQPTRDFEAFPNENDKFAVIGRAGLGRSQTFPGFGHIDQIGSSSHYYAFMQDNTNGDTYLNGGENETLFFTSLNTGVATYKLGKFRIGSISEGTHKFQTSGNSKVMKWNIPYIYLHSPSTSFTGSNNFFNLSSGDHHTLQHYEARLINIFTYSRAADAGTVTIPTGYAGWYRIHCHCSIAAQGNLSREFRMSIYNRSTEIGSHESNIEIVGNGTYSQMTLTVNAQCDNGDVIKASVHPSESCGVHYPNTHMTMFMLNGHSI
jgi:hypothetical protein|tara:strand:+ start:1164 stop:2189 length:1026 start_codon:yes stop_codon:yes gene_type:complete